MTSSALINLKAFCNSCKAETNHMVNTTHRVDEVYEWEGENEEGEVVPMGNPVSTSFFEVITCKGCESVSFRTKTDYNEQPIKRHILGDNYRPLRPDITYYPERLQDWLSEKPVAGLPQNVRKAYQEVLYAYNFNLLLLCASGLRSIVEGLCAHFNTASQDAGGRSVALGSRVRELANKRLIPNSLADALRAHKELGNDAVHNLIAPDKAGLKLAIELVENAFENLFNIAKRHHELGDKMMRRMLP